MGEGQPEAAAVSRTPAESGAGTGRGGGTAGPAGPSAQFGLWGKICFLKKIAKIKINPIK